MMPAIFVNFVTRARKHIGRQIDAGDVAVMGIRRKRRPSTGANLEYLRADRNIQVLNHPFDAVVEDLAEDFIVEGSEFSVEFALVRLDFSHAPQPQSTTSD